MVAKKMLLSRAISRHLRISRQPLSLPGANIVPSLQTAERYTRGVMEMVED
jgi:hypothetical protein